MTGERRKTNVDIKFYRIPSKVGSLHGMFSGIFIWNQIRAAQKQTGSI